MKSICHEVQERLAEGLEILREDEAARRHLDQCPECTSVKESLAALDQALQTLPAHDAPEGAVRRLLTRVESVGSGPTPGGGVRLGGLGELAAAAAGLSWVRRVVWGVAGAAAAVAFVGLMAPRLYRAEMSLNPGAYAVAPRDAVAPPPMAFEARPPRASQDGPVSPRPAFDPPGLAEEGDALSRGEAEQLRALGYAGGDDSARQLEWKELDRLAGRLREGAQAAAHPAPADPTVGDRTLTPEARKNETLEEIAKGKDDDETAAWERDMQQAAEIGVLYDRVEDLEEAVKVIGEMPLVDTKRRGAKTVIEPVKTLDAEPVYPEAAREAGVEGDVVVEITLDREGRVAHARVLRGVPRLDEAALDTVKKWRYKPTLVEGRPVPVVLEVTVSFRLPEPTEAQEGQEGPSTGDTGEAGEFLNERSSTRGLAFPEARGYWTNTYVPGDPVLRLLQARLAAWDRSALEAAAGVPLRLHDAALQTAQPFDSPRRGALALYLQADRRGIEGESRMLVQVGLRGSARAGSRRPAMNVGVVLDLRGEDLPVEVAAGMRALALAFAQAREVGDRFQIVVAGRPGAVAVEPSEFKHGPLMVTLARLLEGGTGLEGRTLDLVEAVAAAFEAVGRGDDPESPLGSSTVVLVTGQALGSQTSALTRLAHQGAVAGIPLSVIGVGPDVSPGEVDRLALAGQGSRRALESRSDALNLVERELAAAAGVVARAVRLRIRLAPGVRLVDVVGSRRLDSVQASRVKEAERSVDLRLSRNLGIEADRGDDEDGIQIVIPSFHAGDSHAILLDVVAPGPGPVAEVTARYKDIVDLRNGVARASLHVGAGSRVDGPLERNVLKTLLAARLSDTLTRAGDRLHAGDATGAVALLERAHALRSGLGALRPAFAGDPELTRDVAMLGEYVRLLRGAVATRPHDRARLADSLRYAGWLKVLPRPAAVAGRGA